MKITKLKFAAAIGALCLLSNPANANFGDRSDFGSRDSRGFGGTAPQSFGQDSQSFGFSFLTFDRFDPPEMPHPFTDHCGEWAFNKAQSFQELMIMIFGLSSPFSAVDVEGRALDDHVKCLGL